MTSEADTKNQIRQLFQELQEIQLKIDAIESGLASVMQQIDACKSPDTTPEEFRKIIDQFNGLVKDLENLQYIRLDNMEKLQRSVFSSHSAGLTNHDDLNLP